MAVLAMLRFILVAALLFPTTALGAYVDDEIRIELPPDGQLRVRNDFGKVSVEAWNETYATVSARVEGPTALTRSPIIIDNRGKLVTISVIRRPIDPVVPVHVHLKIPANVDIAVWSAKGYVKPEIQSSSPEQQNP